MKSREEILILLKNLLKMEEEQEREYYKSSRNSQDKKTIGLFQNIRLRKNKFCTNLRKEIHGLEQVNSKEFSEETAADFFCHSTSKPLPGKEFVKNGELQKCYSKEEKNLQLYNHLLSKIFLGRIREVLLEQKHLTLLNLKELERLIQGSKIR